MRIIIIYIITGDGELKINQWTHHSDSIKTESKRYEICCEHDGINPVEYYGEMLSPAVTVQFFHFLPQQTCRR